MGRSIMAVADMAGKWWDAGVVEYIGRYYASDFTRRMLTAAAQCALWADSSHDDDTEGTGAHAREIADYASGYAPDYEDALPAAARSELESDVENFARMAWPYLILSDMTPEQAGHDFELSRNGHGTGFWDRGNVHGTALTDIAETFGSFGLNVSGHGDDMAVYGHHN